MSDDYDNSDQLAEPPRDERRPLAYKYAVMALLAFALFLYRSRDRLRPTYIGLAILSLSLAAIAAWCIEVRHGSNLDWLLSFLLYAMCSLGAAVLLFVGIRVILAI